MAIGFDLFYISLLIYCFVHSDGEASENENEKSMRRNYNKWTPDEEAKLLLFDVLTDDGKPKSFERLKSYWHDAYPDSNVTDAALRRRLYKLREESQEEGELKRNLKWNHERRTELLDIYYTTRPYKPDANRTLDEEWRRRYKDSQLSRKILLGYVRQISRQRDKIPMHLLEGIRWDNQCDSDLLHAHYVTQLEGEAPWKNAHRIWSDLHPQYSHVTLEQLRQRKTYLKNNPPNEYFPWTEEGNEELLDIFYKTMPDVEDQGQRIYDIWSKRHPRYKFMTPYYLQIHASTLAHERKMQKADNPIGRGYTYEEKADLVNLYRRHLRERPGYHGFHKEWVRKQPRLAYLTNVHLKKYARKLEDKRFSAASGELGEGLFHKGKVKCALKEKQKLHGEYGESSSKNRGHSKQSIKGYREKHEVHTLRQFGSMRKLDGGLEKQRSEKPYGKAKVMYHSDKQESSTPSISESSE